MPERSAFLPQRTGSINSDRFLTLAARLTACLLAEAASPLAATQLNNYFAMTIRRAIATTNASVQGIPIAAVEFVPVHQQPWDAAEV